MDVSVTTFNASSRLRINEKIPLRLLSDNFRSLAMLFRQIRPERIIMAAMGTLNLMVYRHSAFYSPLIAGIAGGFFAAEGFEPTYTIMPPGKTVGEMLVSGAIHVSQTAVSGSWPYLEKGERPPFVSFAQINQRDGFQIASRNPVREFGWSKLTSGKFMFAHGGQPQAMLAYALHKKGVSLDKTCGIDAGDPQRSMNAFRNGQGDWYHEQAPYPQQLQHEGTAEVVASVGQAIGPVAFSSLAAMPRWLSSPDAIRFTRAYRKARAWVQTTPAATVAKTEQPFFADIAPDALVSAIRYYQELGCWDGEIEIDPRHYETALDVFAYSKLITKRHAFEKVVVAPPR
jgi:NitT/TauT family transport system substrate-binding protein